jgi:hypothetical protein
MDEINVEKFLRNLGVVFSLFQGLSKFIIEASFHPLVKFSTTMAPFYITNIWDAN